MITIAFYILMSAISITQTFMLVDEQKRHDRLEEEIEIMQYEDACQHDAEMEEDGYL